eukprot:4429084-Alexandrium_andersonii.AAC.1
MSASLVGSEMCIRDSARGARGARGAQGAGGTSAKPRGTAPGCRRSPAVSYTHLTLPTICSV